MQEITQASKNARKPGTSLVLGEDEQGIPVKIISIDAGKLITVPVYDRNTTIASSIQEITPEKIVIVRADGKTQTILHPDSKA